MSDSMAIPDRAFGELLGAFQALKEDVAELKADSKEAFKEVKAENKTIQETLDGIKTRFDRIDGGWKVLMIVGGAAGTAGGVLVGIVLKMWPFLLGTLPKV